MEETEEIESILSDDITCPYCKLEFSDSWELISHDGDTQEIECRSCDKIFQLTCHITVTWESEAIKNENT